MVQNGVDVMEDVPLGDRRVVVVGAESFERPVGDVLAAVRAVFGVSVEGEDLKGIARTQVNVGNPGNHKGSVWRAKRYITENQNTIFCFALHIWKERRNQVATLHNGWVEVQVARGERPIQSCPHATFGKLDMFSPPKLVLKAFRPADANRGYEFVNRCR